MLLQCGGNIEQTRFERLLELFHALVGLSHDFLKERFFAIAVKRLGAHVFAPHAAVVILQVLCL